MKKKKRFCFSQRTKVSHEMRAFELFNALLKALKYNTS